MIETKQMSDKYFVDSNIWLYLFQNDLNKKQIAQNLFSLQPTISTQVLQENCNVCLRKFKMQVSDIQLHIQNLQQYCQVVEITENNILKALQIHQMYQYGFYDSLIISVALDNQCNVLYSEDLQHRQVIENQLEIINPFI